MSSLDRDLLYEIAEKLVYVQADEFNFDDVSNVMKFMFLDHACKTAFLSQFSRIKTYIFDWIQSDFHNSTVGSEIEYYGAIEKDKWLVALLIEAEKFRPRRLILNSAFGSVMEKKFVNLDHRSPLECLANLFEISESKLDLHKYPGPNLVLDYVEVNGEVDGLVNLDKILGLDAKEVELNVMMKEFHCMPDVANYSSVKPSRTEVVKLMFTSNWCDSNDGEPYKKFPAVDWIKLFSYILTSCCNIKVLKVRVVISDGDDDRFPNLTCDRLLKAMKSMKNDVLPVAVREGCFLEVEFASYLSGTALEGIQASNQELFSLGVRQPLEDNLEVCRTIPFDKRAALSFSIYRSDEGSVSNVSLDDFNAFHDDGWGFSDEEIAGEDDGEESYYIGSDGDDKIIIIE